MWKTLDEFGINSELGKMTRDQGKEEEDELLYRVVGGIMEGGSGFK